MKYEIPKIYTKYTHCFLAYIYVGIFQRQIPIYVNQLSMYLVGNTSLWKILDKGIDTRLK